MPQIFRLLGGLAIAVILAAGPAMAQEAPPARVGRVALVAGTISFHMAGETGWSAAGLNYPVATGGSFWTDPRSRAQLRIGPTTLAMANGTEVDVTTLNREAARLYVPLGRIWLRVRELGDMQTVEIDIPQGAVQLLEPGEYDIDAGSENAPGRVAVYEGSARFVSGGGVVTIHRGERARLSGFSPVSAELGPAVPDEFVAWSRARDYRATRLAAPRYISPYMTGYAELDEYGRWERSPEYGEVWYPRAMPAGWAPYRYGHWVWIAPWGWTWVDREPWGFAPFHYGRWALIGGRWGWVPGRFERHPVYAPALVAFVGAVSLSARHGPTVGWFPLAPGELYWPSYTRSVDYIRRVNVTNVTNITNIRIDRSGRPPPQVLRARYANRVHATVVPRRVFADARPVAPARVHVAPTRLRGAAVAVQPPQVRPVFRRPAHLAAPPPHPAARGGRAATGPAIRRLSVPPPSMQREAAPARPSGPTPTERRTTPSAPRPRVVRPTTPAHRPPAIGRETTVPQSPQGMRRHLAVSSTPVPVPQARRHAPPRTVTRPAGRPGSAERIHPGPSERRRAPPHATTRPERGHRPAGAQPRAPEAKRGRAIERQRFEAPRQRARPPARQTVRAPSRAVSSHPPRRRATPAPAHARSHPAPERRRAAHRGEGAADSKSQEHPNRD